MTAGRQYHPLLQPPIGNIRNTGTPSDQRCYLCSACYASQEPAYVPDVSGADAERENSVQAWAETIGLAGKAVLSTDEAAEVLQISERSVRQGIKDGTIPVMRLGRRVLIPVPRLLEMLINEPEAAA